MARNNLPCHPAAGLFLRRTAIKKVYSKIAIAHLRDINLMAKIIKVFLGIMESDHLIDHISDRLCSYLNRRDTALGFCAIKGKRL